MVHENVRRLVLASLGDQEPECGICLEKFTHADATVMDCAHVICRRCSERTRDAGRCPFCRHEFLAHDVTLDAISMMQSDMTTLTEANDMLEEDNEFLEENIKRLVKERDEWKMRAQGLVRPNSPIPPSN